LKPRSKIFLLMAFLVFLITCGNNHTATIAGPKHHYQEMILINFPKPAHQYDNEAFIMIIEEYVGKLIKADGIRYVHLIKELKDHPFSADLCIIIRFRSRRGALISRRTTHYQNFFNYINTKNLHVMSLDYYI
jgi:hypothetical protein